jgi:hypothetical protein
MGWETADAEPSTSGRTVSRGGLLRTGVCLLALAGYGVAGWLAWRAVDLLEGQGQLPQGILGTLNAPPEAVIGPVALGGSLLVAHFAAGLTAVALGIGGAGAPPLVPPPGFDERERRALRRGGLLLSGVAVVGAGLAAAPFTVEGGFAFVTGIGGLAGVGLFVAYLLGALYVVSVLVPPLSSDAVSAVVLLAAPVLVAVDFLVRQGVGGGPLTRTAVALGVDVAVVVGLARPLQELVPAVAEARRRWVLFAAVLLAAITTWGLAGVVAPVLPSAFGALAVLGLVPLALLARGYVV